MDLVFLAVIVALYAVTHGLVWAVARIGGRE
jgi:hypothetical protein